MNVLHCAIAAVATIIVLPTFQALGHPVEPNYPCYMQTPTGRVIDLTSRLCLSAQPTQEANQATVVLSGKDAEFIEKYKQQARLVENRATAQKLIAEADQNPEAKVVTAQQVCGLLSNRFPLGLIESAEATSVPTAAQSPIGHAAGMANIGIISQLAVEVYCPRAFSLAR